MIVLTIHILQCRHTDLITSFRDLVTGILAMLGLALARKLEAAEDQEPLNEADGDSSDGAATEAHMI